MSKPTYRAGIAIILVVVAASGFMLGSYFWFGGYMSTRNTFYRAAFLLSMIGAVALFNRSWIGAGRSFGFLLLSMLCFEVFVSIGQVHYVGSKDMGDCFGLFMHALNRSI
jgi:hypothetical protein